MKLEVLSGDNLVASILGKETEMKKNIYPVIAAAIIAVLVSLACGFGSTAVEPTADTNPSGAGQPTASNKGPAPTQTQAATDCASSPPHDYTGPAPQAGTANLYGFLLWNSIPQSNLAIQACLDSNYKNECEEPIYAATSDNNGAFLIANLPPGEYDVVVHALSQEKWLDVKELTGDYHVGEVEADRCISTGNVNLIKFDLFQKSPANNARLSEARPVLTWDAYPDAAYYEIYWGSDEGQAVLVSERVNTNQVTSPVDVLSCKYAWDVTAFNAQSVPIAETEEYFYFYVEGQPISCYVVNTKPASNSTVPGANIVLSWDAHPLAVKYQVAMVMSSPTYKKIIDYVEVTEPRLALDVTLEPGDYYWNVYAIDQYGNTVAGDEGNTYLTVK
jgi:hypothetical protein